MGAIASPGGAPLGLVNLNPATVPLVVKGAASQTADLQQWQSSTGSVLASVNSGGVIVAPGFNGNTVQNTGTSGSYLTFPPNNGATFITRTSTNPGLIVQGVASQTADLQQWQSGTSAVLAKVDSSGAIAPQNGARITSGSGVPTTPGGINPTAGDVYHRKDTPGVAMQNIYKCTVGGATPTWVALV